MRLWRIEMLGGLKVRFGDREVTRFRTQKTASLLAYLACRLGRPQSREVLAELFWPESDTATARNNVSVALSSLRSLLETPQRGGVELFVADRQSVGLNPEAVSVDVDEFRRAWRAAAGRTGAERLEALERALAAYGGELLPGFYDEWIWPERAQLAEDYADVVQAAVTERVNAGDWTGAVEIARQALRLAPESPRLEDLAARLLGEASGAVTTSADGGPQAGAGYGGLGPPLTGTITVAALVVGSPAGRETSAAEALLQHCARLAQEHGGRVLSVRDGTVTAAFGRSSDAAGFAVAAQLARAKEFAATGSGLVLKGAIHTGEVLPEDQAGRDPLGALVDVAVQLGGAAHGGQLLCSETSAALLRPDSGAALWLTDLGLFRVGERARPQRVHQVNYPEMETAQFPPLQAPGGHEDRLPVQLTSFLGRAEELEQLETVILDRHGRLTTITGTGDAGKTRLAIQFGRRVLDAFKGAVWFAELADVNSVDLVWSRLREVLRVPLTPERHPLGEICRVLRQQPSLLILDNFEHLAEAAGEVIEPLLERAPNLACLVTSRRLLGLQGEAELVLGPLPAPPEDATFGQIVASESVQLFVDRARQARPDFALSETNAAAVAEICRRVEGLPLALELAAARTQVLSPAQVLERLGSAFDLLVSRHRDVPDRHRSLRAALDWSYGLLRPELQEAFARLAAFEGGWTLEAAEAVCPGGLVLDHLADLREASLLFVEPGPTPRYRFLETVRIYAAEKLAERPDADDAYRRHFEHYYALVCECDTRLAGGESAEVLALLDVERANTHAAWRRLLAREPEDALRLANALWRYWVTRGEWQEAREALEVALAAATEAPDDLRAQVVARLGHVAFKQGDTQAAKEYLGAALDFCRRLDDPAGASHALTELGKVAWAEGDYRGARAHHEESLAILRRIGDEWGVAAALSGLAAVSAAEGDLDGAERRLQESLALRRSVGDERGVAGALDNLGVICRARRDYARAIEYLEESLAIRRRLGDRRGIALALSDLGVVAMEYGNRDAALAYHGESLAIRRELGDRRGEASSLNNLGLLGLALGDFDAALAHQSACLAIRRDIGDRQGEAVALNNLGDVAAAQGDYATARRCYEESLEIFLGLGAPRERTIVFLNLGEVAYAEGDLDGAERWLREAHAMVTESGDTWVRGYLATALGNVALARGDLATAAEQLRLALEDNEANGDQGGALMSVDAAVRLAAARGDLVAAAELKGGVERARTEVSLPRRAPEAALQEHLAARLRDQLGEEALAGALARGAALTWSDLVALAHRVLAP